MWVFAASLLFPNPYDKINVSNWKSNINQKGVLRDGDIFK